MGVPSEGGTSDKVVSLVLASAGIDAHEVKRQVVGLVPGTFNLVQQGRIAGYVVSIDTANILPHRIPMRGCSTPPSTSSRTASSTPPPRRASPRSADNLRRFLAAIHEAMAFMVADKNFDKTITILRGKYKFATLDNDAIARASLGMLRESWTGGDPSKPLLVTDEAAWAAGYKELTDAGLLQSGEDPQVLVRQQPVAQVVGLAGPADGHVSTKGAGCPRTAPRRSTRPPEPGRAPEPGPPERRSSS